MKRRAARVDANQPQVVNELRHMGVSVAHTHQLGNGFPDLVCAKWGVNLLVELKDPSQPPSHQRLTPDEHRFLDGWRGPILIARTSEEIYNRLLELSNG